jgi:hypothetical protein
MSEAHTSGNLTGSSPALAFCMKMKKYYLSLHGNAIFVKTKIRKHAPSYPETQRREQGKAIGRHQRTAKDNLDGRRHICNHMLYPISHAAMEIEVDEEEYNKISRRIRRDDFLDKLLDDE